MAVAMDRSPLIKRFLYPLLVISQTVPIYALAPLFLIWFGLGLFSKVVIVSLVCFFFPWRSTWWRGWSRWTRSAGAAENDAGRALAGIPLAAAPSVLPYFSPA